MCVFIEYAYAVCVAVCGCFRRAERVSVGVCFGTSSETVAALVGMSAKMFLWVSDGGGDLQYSDLSFSVSLLRELLFKICF